MAPEAYYPADGVSTATGVLTKEGPSLARSYVALRFATEVDSGNMHVNSGPGFRADLMPYGGLKRYSPSCNRSTSFSGGVAAAMPRPRVELYFDSFDFL